MFKHKKVTLGAFSLAILANVLLGTNAVVIKIAAETMDPLLFSALRYILIAVILYLFITDFSFLRKKKLLLKLGLHSLLLLAFVTFWTVGVDRSGALKASLLSLVVPIFVYVFSVTFLREPLIKRAMVGCTVALLGSLLLIGLPTITGQMFQIGDLYILLAFFVFAIYVVHSKHLYIWLTPQVVTSFSMAIAGAMLLGLISLTKGVTVFSEDVRIAWLPLLYGVTVSGALGLSLFYGALKNMPAENAAPIFYVDPLTGSLAAAILLGEQLGTGSVIGAIVIIAGVIISHPYHMHLFHHMRIHHDLGFFKRHWLALKNRV